MDLLTGTDEQLVTTSRIPRPVSKIAENVTVVTAGEIEKLNAHTISEVLDTIPGIQFDRAGRTPGQWDTFTIQGASSPHILVMIDGVTQNALGMNMADLGLMSVQQVDRIEIIKGGASAAWGQALAGVVNIITKSPNPETKFSGTTFSSFGDRFTSEQRAEVSGTIDRFGYYLSGGYLHSDGLLSNNGTNQNNLFGKFVYALPSKGSLTLTLSNLNSQRGLEEVPPPDDWHDNDSLRKTAATAILAYPLAHKLNLEVTTHYSFLKDDTRWGFMTTTDLWKHFFVKETDWGVTGKVIWGDSRFNMATGIDYEHNQIEQREPVQGASLSQYDKGFNRYGIYANGTLSFGKVTILPGIRYDRVDALHNEVSYTLGATYRFTEKSVLRGYFARGYSRSLLNASAPPQKGWTVQTGVETGEIPYLLLKGTLFYNDYWDMENTISTGSAPSQIRWGGEIELRTVPLYGVSLSAGYTLTDLRNAQTWDRINMVPADLIKLGITYDNPLWGLHGILTGNYVWWNSSPEYRAEDRNFLWNLHLTQKVLPNSELSPELFLNIHNLWNTSQYALYQYANSGRWMEGGVRIKF